MAKKTIILAEYLDYIDIFSKKLFLKLFKYIDINKHAINQESDKQILYDLI